MAAWPHLPRKDVRGNTWALTQPLAPPRQVQSRSTTLVGASPSSSAGLGAGFFVIVLGGIFALTMMGETWLGKRGG